MDKLAKKYKSTVYSGGETFPVKGGDYNILVDQQNAIIDEVEALQGVDLSADQYAAIGAANAPDASNAFATMADVPSGLSAEFIVADGSDGTDATPITKNYTGVLSANGTKGVILPVTALDFPLIVFNNANNTLKLYAQSGQTISLNGASQTGGGYSFVELLPYQSIVLVRKTTTQWSGVVTADELTNDEVAAIQDAASPSGTNVFATMADIPEGLPAYTVADNGKRLEVVAGVATWVTP